MQNQELQLTILAFYDSINGNVADQILETREQQNKVAGELKQVDETSEELEQAIVKFEEMKNNLSMLYEASIPNEAREIIIQDFDTKIHNYSEQYNQLLDKYIKDSAKAELDSIKRIQDAQKLELDVISSLKN